MARPFWNDGPSTNGYEALHTIRIDQNGAIKLSSTECVLELRTCKHLRLKNYSKIISSFGLLACYWSDGERC
jgi:hypothetical protein